MSCGRAGCAIAAIGAVLALAGCGDDAEPRGDAHAGGSLVVAEATAPGSLDPALVTTAVARRTIPFA